MFDELYRLPYITLTTFICVCFGIWKWKSMNAGDKIILTIVFYTLVQEFLIIYLTRKGQYNLFIYNLGDIFKFTLFLLYFRIKSPQKWIRNASLLLIPILIIWGIINYFYVQGINTFNTLTYIPAAFIVGLFSYLNLRRLIIADSISKHNMQLWILIANCLYYFVNIPMEGMEPFIVKVSIPLAKKIRSVPNVFQHIWVIMITLGLLWKKRSRI